MPYYVKRDFGGRIESASLCAQPTWPEEQLGDDDEELVSFLAKFPSPPAQQLDFEALDRISAESARVNKETEEIGNLILRFLSEWADLENVCSRLFYDVVQCSSPESHVPYAIYHALPGFEARLGVLNAALLQFFVENKELFFLRDPWRRFLSALREIKKTRNFVAHGSVTTIHHQGQHHVRLTAPWFDVRKNMNLLINHNVPGMDGAKLSEDLAYLAKVSFAVGSMIRVLDQYRKYGERVLNQATAEMETALTGLKIPE
ncbi:hypothetical protein N5I84_03385 [Ralstonia sp. CHL-2022]|uniref:hypothetical protein n=1 Tax=Ralstonia mojiangensis TaxID=2953895 RepID=UPI0021B3266D|nr:hypothetical protein [Ralstonia mojiangensis]MCT7295200.1 hypothetical protein [Ralstonia mojiangensis]